MADGKGGQSRSAGAFQVVMGDDFTVENAETAEKQIREKRLTAENAESAEKQIREKRLTAEKAEIAEETLEKLFNFHLLFSAISLCFFSAPSAFSAVKILLFLYRSSQ